MARAAKSVNNIQVFRGSLSRPDVFAQNSGAGCCGPSASVDFDKLGSRVHFDNALAHLNPAGANDKLRVPLISGINNDKQLIVNHINEIGVGATISVLTIPTYAFVTGVGVHIAAEEPGLTFNLITRNGLVIPLTQYMVEAEADPDNACGVLRTLTTGDGDPSLFAGFGALGTNLFIDLFARGDSLSLEADELILQVATMPVGPVVGLFDLTVAANYEVINRAEQ